MIADNDEFGTLSTLETAPWTDKVLGSNFNAQDAAKRLRIAIDRIGGNKGVMAKTGIPSRTLSAYLAGGDMKRASLVALAKACGVNLVWLATGEGPMAGEPAPPPSPTSEPQKSGPDVPTRAFATINPDQLAKAMEAAAVAFQTRGAKPSMRQLAQVTLLLYDAPEGAQEPITK